MRRTIVQITVLLLAGLGWAGCQQPPTEEPTSAQTALSAAEESDARQYAADELKAASAALDAAKAEIGAQSQRFAIVRDYDQAKKLFALALEKADAARDAAVAAKEQAKADAETALADLGSSLEGAHADLAALAGCRKKPKGLAAHLEALTGRLEALGAERAGIDEEIGREAYRDAVVSAGTLSASVSTLLADLQSARAQLGC